MRAYSGLKSGWAARALLLFIKVHIDPLMAEGERVVLEARGEAQTKDGRAYDNSYCIVVTVRDGKVSQVREYLDAELVTRVFGA